MGSLTSFNLLALGHRGVGKTVFLAGSYASSRPNPKLSRDWRLWFDCQNITEQQHLEEVLRRVASTGRYPPPTVKVTSFRFRLQRRNLLSTQTLCQFHWCDVPGEICSLRDPRFQSILLKSHGGCLFVDAPALAKHGQIYLETLESLIRQVELISAHVDRKGIRFPFALILTKCDSLRATTGPQVTSNPQNLVQLHKNLEPLLTRLNRAKTHYQIFHSAIPIVAAAGIANLQSTPTATPFLWLMSELRTLYRWQKPQVLATKLAQLFHSSEEQKEQKTAGKLVLPSQKPLPRSRVANVSRFLGVVGLTALSLGLGFKFLFGQGDSVDPHPVTQSAEQHWQSLFR